MKRSSVRRTVADDAQARGGGETSTRSAQDPASASATLRIWKAKYGGMDVSDARRLRALEDENSKLKKLLLAHRVMLDHVRS